MEIKVLKQNSVYRVADIFLKRGIRWEEDRHKILTNYTFNNTILRHYLQNKKYEFDYNCLEESIQNFIKNKKITAPSDNTLVIHLRLGDVCEPGFKRSYYRLKKDYYESTYLSYKKIHKWLPFDRLIESGVEKAMVVTALHYGANDINNKYFYSETSYKRSHILLELVINQIQLQGLSCDISSNNDVDIDFCLLSKAKTLLTSNSKFSKIAANCFAKQKLFLHTNQPLLNSFRIINKQCRSFIKL